MPMHTATRYFALFNLLVYTAAFLGRILRDTLLFTRVAGEGCASGNLLCDAPSGADVFPLVLVANAVLMTWFAGRLGDWWDRLGARRTLLLGFLGSALWLALGAWWLGGDTPVWWLLLFYIGSEIPIFLLMNLIWMLAGDYFTEQDQQRYFPRIAAWGLFGVSLGSGVILLNHYLGRPFDEFDLLWFWAMLLVGLVGLVWLIFSRLTPINTVSSDVGPDAGFSDANSPDDAPANALSADWRWVRTNRYLWLFTLVTVCNFFLLGVFDQTLARGAEHLGTGTGALANQLAWWVFGFGLFAAAFQWFGFPRLLGRLGVGKLNLFAPGLLLAGALVYIMLASDWLKPVFELPQEALLSVLIGVRILGWAAEFLFNQSMLPFIYGALPQAEEQRGRLFVEGPVTALTNGAVGLFLIFYFWAFADTQGGSYGFRMDLLFFIAAVISGLMLVWSWRMVPELSRSLLRRISAGGAVDTHYRHALQIGGNQLINLLGDAEKVSNVSKQRIQTLVRVLGTDAAPRLLGILRDTAQDGVRAETWRALAEINALEALQQAWDSLNACPGAAELEAALSAMRHAGLSAHTNPSVQAWLQQARGKELLTLLEASKDLGLDAGIQVAESVRSRLEADDFDADSLLYLASALGGDRFYPAIAHRLRQAGADDLAWQRLGRLHFTDHALAFDAFALLLGRAESPQHPATRGLADLIGRYPWLCWPLAALLAAPLDATPPRLRPQRAVWPHLIDQAGVALWRLTDLVLLRAMLDRQSDESNAAAAPELDGVDWGMCTRTALHKALGLGDDTGQFDSTELLARLFSAAQSAQQEPGLFLAFATVLHTRKADWTDALAQAQRHAADAWRLHAALALLFHGHQAQAFDWLRRRHLQWLQADLTLHLMRYPQAAKTLAQRGFAPVGMARALAGADAVAHDRVLTALEQSGLPRDAFIRLRDDLQALRNPKADLSSYWPPELSYPATRDDLQALWPSGVAHILPDAMLREILPDQPAGET